MVLAKAEGRLPRRLERSQLTLVEGQPLSLAERLVELMDRNLRSYLDWGGEDLILRPAKLGYQKRAGLDEYGAILAELDGREEVVCFARFNPQAALRVMQAEERENRDLGLVGLTHLIGVCDGDEGSSLLAVVQGVAKISGPPLGEGGELRVSLGEERGLLGRVHRVEEEVVDPERAVEEFLGKMIAILAGKKGRSIEAILSVGDQALAASFPPLGRERSKERLYAGLLKDKIVPLLEEFLRKKCVVLN